MRILDIPTHLFMEGDGAAATKGLEQGGVDGQGGVGQLGRSGGTPQRVVQHRHLHGKIT